MWLVILLARYSFSLVDDWTVHHECTMHSFAQSSIPEQDDTFPIELRRPDVLLLKSPSQKKLITILISTKNELRSDHWFFRGQPEKETGKERCDSVAVPQL